MILPILKSSLDTSTGAASGGAAPFFSLFPAPFSPLGLDDFSFFFEFESVVLVASAPPVAPLALLVVNVVVVVVDVIVGVSILGIAVDDNWAAGGVDEGRGI